MAIASFGTAVAAGLTALHSENYVKVMSQMAEDIGGVLFSELIQHYSALSNLGEKAALVAGVSSCAFFVTSTVNTFKSEFRKQ